MQLHSTPHAYAGVRALASLALSVVPLWAAEGAEPEVMIADASKNMILSEDAAYEAGRGLLTIQGPTGMFINPTSATLPANAFTAQYCFFNDLTSDPTFGHGWLFGFGLTDWLEAGVTALYVNADAGPFAIGPYARVRVLKRDGIIPQASIGYYGRYGSSLIQQNGLFGALYQRLELGDGLVKSVGFHGGLRANWFEGAEDQFHVYSGVEVQFPYRLYLVGEIMTKDDDVDTELPFAYGLQWRAAAVNISAAMVQPGGIADGPGFFFGIGTQRSF